ncbi:MAG: hypothetical protein FWD71_21285 [Oscillospiraceae bacterium]|nr:hypothetical protein [Oscillospiraceae bacterium]
MEKSFDENLVAFLTELRESAINELSGNNGKHRGLCLDVSEKMRKAKEIPAEYANIIEALVDSMFALSRAEKNYLYLQGFRDCISLYKRLGGSFSENRELDKLFT